MYTCISLYEISIRKQNQVAKKIEIPGPRVKYLPGESFIVVLYSVLDSVCIYCYCNNDIAYCNKAELIKYLFQPREWEF